MGPAPLDFQIKTDILVFLVSIQGDGLNRLQPDSLLLFLSSLHFLIYSSPDFFPIIDLLPSNYFFWAYDHRQAMSLVSGMS